MRRKKRAWQRQQVHELLDQLCREPRYFWQRVNRQLTSMPQQVQDPAAWEAIASLQRRSSRRRGPKGVR